MPDMNQREYQSVILGALLHDVGKLWQLISRSSPHTLGSYNGLHYKRQETRMKMGGILGSVTFSGDLPEFMPYLLLGEHLHVWKGTSFGLGKHEMVSHL